MTYVPFVPHVPFGSGGSGGPAGKPPWLKLEEGEVYVRAYGGSAARARRPLIAILIGLVILAGLGVFSFAIFSQRSAPVQQIAPDESVPWIAIATGAILILNAGVLIAVKMSRSGKAAAYLTSKMLIVKSGQDYAGVRLADITAIEAGSGAEQNVLIVRARTAQQPVARLPVTDLAAARVELTAYSKAAGAKLQ